MHRYFDISKRQLLSDNKDYLCNWLGITKLKRAKADELVFKLKKMFVRFGVAGEIMSGNAP